MDWKFKQTIGEMLKHKQKPEKNSYVSLVDDMFYHYILQVSYRALPDGDKTYYMFKQSFTK